jgi:hypothetical protein
MAQVAFRFGGRHYHDELLPILSSNNLRNPWPRRRSTRRPATWSRWSRACACQCSCVYGVASDELTKLHHRSSHAHGVPCHLCTAAAPLAAIAQGLRSCCSSREVVPSSMSRAMLASFDAIWLVVPYAACAQRAQVQCGLALVTVWHWQRSVSSPRHLRASPINVVASDVHVLPASHRTYAPTARASAAARTGGQRTWAHSLPFCLAAARYGNSNGPYASIAVVATHRSAS